MCEEMEEEVSSSYNRLGRLAGVIITLCLDIACSTRKASRESDGFWRPRDSADIVRLTTGANVSLT